jgi:transcription antitermination factor NusG
MEYPSGTNWYPVITRSREEISSAELLEAKGLDIFLPLTKKIINNGKRNGRQRTKVTDLPLLSRYIFCNANLDQVVKGQSLTAYYIINTTPGIVGLVGIGSKALVIDEEAMDIFIDMCIIEDGKYYHKPEVEPIIQTPRGDMTERGIIAGKAIEVTEGPFAGYKGTYEGIDGKGMVDILNEQFFKWSGKRLKVDGNHIRLVT